MASAIHDVPVPAVAGLDPAMSVSNREVYRLPRSESLSSLAAFYARTMPVGMPFKGFEWCGGKTVPLPGALSLERVWRAPGTNDFLVLQLTNDQTGPLVTIIDERNSPARTCSPSPSK